MGRSSPARPGLRGPSPRAPPSSGRRSARRCTPCVERSGACPRRRRPWSPLRRARRGRRRRTPTRGPAPPAPRTRRSRAPLGASRFQIYNRRVGTHAATGASGVMFRGYPVLLPRLRDARLHLAVVITSLQVLGQVGFGFRVSVAQILVSLVTCAALEVAIAFWRQRVILWPASALITGNGVAFILRLPGTRHGDWWSLNGWWIYAVTAAVSLLSKHVIKLRGAHIFNPSNFGLVLCFLILGSGRAAPLDFWWGPASGWLVAALVIIVGGGLMILSRLHLLRIAVAFWLAFAAAIGVLATT